MYTIVLEKFCHVWDLFSFDFNSTFSIHICSEETFYNWLSLQTNSPYFFWAIWYWKTDAKWLKMELQLKYLRKKILLYWLSIKTLQPVMPDAGIIATQH